MSWPQRAPPAHPVIVTSNLRDFPALAPLAPLGVEAPAPDDFLLQLYALDAEAVRAVQHRQAVALVNPPMTPLGMVAALRRDAPGFSSLLEQDLCPNLTWPDLDGIAPASPTIQAVVSEGTKKGWSTIQ